MRRAFSNTLLALAETDERLIFLTGDLGYQVFDEFVERFGERYINVGIAEAQMVGAAAGMALEGFKPFVYSIASFMTGRAFEQIKIAVSYHQLPVIIVGAGGGYTYATSGVTHHAAEDLGLMSMLPGMTVVCPGSPEEVSTLLPQMYALSTPSYIRIGRFGDPEFEGLDPIILGKARKVRQGKGIAILTSGTVVHEAISALDELKKQNLGPSLYHFHTIKPFDSEAMNNILLQHDHIIVAEEHHPVGGLYSEVTKFLSSPLFNNRTEIRIHRLGPTDEVALGNFNTDTIRKNMRYDKNAIVTLCQKLG